MFTTHQSVTHYLTKSSVLGTMYAFTALGFSFVFICNARAINYQPVFSSLVSPLLFANSTNELCRKDGDLFFKSLGNNTLWAYRMWDASAKIPIGLTEGSQYQLGNFDECLSIMTPFSTQYCLATINIKISINVTVKDPYSLDYKPHISLYEKLNTPKDPNKIPRNKIFWALCVPASCRIEDIQNELQNQLKTEQNRFVTEYRVEIKPNDCQTLDSGYNFTTMDFTFCILLASIIITVVISSIYNICYLKNKEDFIEKKKFVKLLLCFSAKENYKELIKSGENDSFRIFYGLKVLMTAALVMGHSISNILTGPILNFTRIEEKNRSLFAMPVCRGDVVVDVFFLISGILNTYNYLIQSDNKNINAIRSIILRYARLVPAFALITFFYTTFFYKFGSGPLWPKIVGAEKSYCEVNWWTNLLLINNYVNIENICVLQGWYLAVDFQLFLLSIPLNRIIKRNTKSSWTIIFTLLCFAISIPFVITFIGQKDPSFYVFNNYFFTLRQNDTFQTVYVPGYTRISPYILGMILGFFYYKQKDKRINISTMTTIMIYLVVILLGGVCIFGGITFYNPYLAYDVLKTSAYAAFVRPTFAIAGGLFLIICNYGTLPIEQKLLSWSPLVPLGKLSFCVYLIHMALQIANAGAKRSPITITMFYWITQTITELALSTVIAFLLFIFVENPCVRFIKEILPKEFRLTKPKIRSNSREVVF